MISITKDCWNKIKAASKAFEPYEVSFYGYVVKKENQHGGSSLELVDILVPKNQVISYATVKTEFAGDAEAIQWQDEMNAARGDNGLVIAQFHTHPTFSVNPSSTDLTDWTEKAKSHDFYIVGIFNSKMEYTLRFLIHGSSFDVKFSTIEDLDNPFKDWAEAIATEMKPVAKFSNQNNYGSRRTSYYGYQEEDDLYDDPSWSRDFYGSKSSKKKTEPSYTTTLTRFLGYDFKSGMSVYFLNTICAIETKELELKPENMKRIELASKFMDKDEYVRKLKIAMGYAYILDPTISFGTNKDYVRIYDAKAKEVVVHSITSLTQKEKSLLITPECNKKNKVTAVNVTITEDRYDLILANSHTDYSVLFDKIFDIDAMEIIDFDKSMKDIVFDATDVIVQNEVPAWYNGLFVISKKKAETIFTLPAVTPIKSEKK